MNKMLYLDNNIRGIYHDLGHFYMINDLII